MGREVTKAAVCQQPSVQDRRQKGLDSAVTNWGMWPPGASIFVLFRAVIKEAEVIRTVHVFKIVVGKLC
jgi:hypothetical protein